MSPPTATAENTAHYYIATCNEPMPGTSITDPNEKKKKELDAKHSLCEDHVPFL